MEQPQPARRSRRQIDYRSMTKADGGEEEEVGDNGDTVASSERINQPEEVIDTTTTDTQSNKLRTNNAGRTNKSRTVFTPEQLALLQDAFEKNPYPSREVREKLEEMTGLGRKRLSDWFGHRRHALKLKRLGSTPSLPTTRASPPTYSHSRSTSPSSDTRSHSPRRRAHSSASPSHTSPYPPVLHSYHSQPEPRTSGLSSLASWAPTNSHMEERSQRSYHPENHRSAAPISHPSEVPFPTLSKHNYSLDSFASRRDMPPQPSSTPPSTHGLQPVRSRPSLEWACAIERQRVRPYPKKPASREAGWSRHGNPGVAETRSRSHSYSTAHGPPSGHKEDGGSETEPEEEDDAHEVLTPPQSLVALERQALVQSFGSAISASTSAVRYDTETQADLDAAMILVGMGKS